MSVAPFLPQLDSHTHHVPLNSIPHFESDRSFEHDEGLMQGDDGGYTNFSQLCNEEDAALNRPTGIYPLLGTHPTHPRNPAVTGILSVSNPVDAFPLEDGDMSSRSPEVKTQPNIFQLIGSDNIVVRNVLVLQNIRGLREKVLSVISQTMGPSQAPSSHPTTPTKSEPTVVPAPSTSLFSARPTAKQPKQPDTELNPTNDCADDESVFEIATHPVSYISSNANPSVHRETALTRAICCLMLTHSGFTDASEHALDILVDLFEHFVHNISHSLAICGEDGETGSVSREEQIRLIGRSGIRGDLAVLMSYVQLDLVRTEQTVHEAQKKLQMQLDVLCKANPSVVIPDASEAVRVTPSLPSKIKSEERDVFMDEASERDEDINEDGEDAEYTARPEINLDAEPFTFGYLNRNVRVDVLGDIKVPRSMAFDGTVLAVEESNESMERSAQKSHAPLPLPTNRVRWMGHL